MEINKYARENVSKLLVGNKSDLAIGEARQVRFEVAKEFADKNRMPFLEASSKTANNVETAFLTMVRACTLRAAGPRDVPAATCSGCSQLRTALAHARAPNGPAPPCRRRRSRTAWRARRCRRTGPRTR